MNKIDIIINEVFPEGSHWWNWYINYSWWHLSFK